MHRQNEIGFLILDVFIEWCNLETILQWKYLVYKIFYVFWKSALTTKWVGHANMTYI